MLLCLRLLDIWDHEQFKMEFFLMKKNLISLCLLGMWLFSKTKSLFKFWVPFPEIVPAIEFAQFAMYSCFSKAKINVIYIFTNKSLNTVHFFPIDLVREEVIVILASQFLMFFNQTALEVCHTPFFFFLVFFCKL